MLPLVEGHGEWEDGTKVRMRIMWKSAAEWAAEIYTYVSAASYQQQIRDRLDHSKPFNLGRQVIVGW
jgi:hypothetical protein